MRLILYDSAFCGIWSEFELTIIKNIFELSAISKSHFISTSRSGIIKFSALCILTFLARLTEHMYTGHNEYFYATVTNL